MDKNILKKFAMESRTELMKKVSDKLKILYIDENFNENKQGELVNLVGDKHSLSLSKIEFEHRSKLIDRIKNYSDNDEIDEQGINGVVEEVAYTWFNRIIAIRYMEVNDITPISKDNQSLGFRILSSKDNQVDPEIMKFTNLANPNLDINYDKEKYLNHLNQDDDNKKFNILLIAVCEKLGRVIPDVFDGQTDYIDILIPDNMLNETGFVTKVIREIPEEYWKEQVEIIGWLYQYYIFDLKEYYKKNVKTYDKKYLPIMTQIFTSDNIVKYMVENSLGKYWIEHGGDKKLIDNWKYYIKDENMEIKGKMPPTSIKCIDPCSGSGHILVYMFDVLYQIYKSEGYLSSDIPELILKNNLYGLDIDDRAGQLSILAVLLKARNYDKDIFNKSVIKNLNIMAIQDSKSLSRIVKGRKDLIEQDNVQDLIDTFKDAKEIGSLLIIEQKDYEKILNKIAENFNPILDNDLLQEARPLIKEAKILSDKYDIVVTNPPYLGIRHFGVVLKKYVENFYSESKYDLCTVFMHTRMLKKCGRLGMVNQTTWLTQTSFYLHRKNIIENQTIENMLILSKNIMDAGLDICSFVIKNQPDNLFKTKYFIIENLDNEIKYSKKYEINNNKFLNSKDYAILYNLSDNLYNIYINGNELSTIAPPKQGLATSDNDRFLKEWYEVDFHKIGLRCKNADNHKWYPCNKGGKYRKWYGNYNKIINWENDGREIKEYASKLYKSYTRTIKNISLYFKSGITWNSLAKELGCRIVPEGFIFETKGSMMFPNKKNLLYILGLMNCKVITEISKIISPTLDFHEGPIGKLPVILNSTFKEKIENIVKENIKLSKRDWDSFETSWDFKKHPLLEFIDSMPGMHDSNAEVPPTHLKIVKNDYGEDCFIADEIPMKAKIYDSYRRWEEYTEKQFNKLKENEEKLNEIFIDIYGLQDELTPEEDDKDVTVRKADRVRDIKSFISYAVGCMFGRYSLDEKGLAYAGGDFDKSKYKTYKVDEDNIIPITDTPYLGDDIVKKFKDFVEVVYGKETLSENLNYIAETLGKKEMESDEDTIRRYFLNDFYKDHVKTYQKRPIYWLFDSGKKNGFKALIYMHRYNESTIAKLRIDYLHKIQEAYRHELNDIEQKLNTDVSVEEKIRLTKEQADLTAKLDELKSYEEKIAHLANQRIKIDLDDGVKINYAKFQDVLAKIK